MTKSTIDIDIAHTKLTNHVPTQLPTGTGTTVHSTLSIHNSYTQCDEGACLVRLVCRACRLSLVSRFYHTRVRTCVCITKERRITK